MYLRIIPQGLEQFRDKEVILFGAATYGQKVVEEFERIGSKVLFFVDNNSGMHQKTIQVFDESTPKEYLVQSPEILKQYSNVPIIIASTYFDEIKEQLQTMGISHVFEAYMGVHRDVIPVEEFVNPYMNEEEANIYLYHRLMDDAPFFAGRLGSVELETICHYEYLEQRKEHPEIAYENNVTASVCLNAGFFPRNDLAIDRFVRLYLEDLGDIDHIFSMWQSRFEDKLYQDYCKTIGFSDYNKSHFPIRLKNSWLKALQGKKVLVIHPFEESIRENYKKRKVLFEQEDFLPEFELLTLKAVQSIAGTKTPYEDWFEALDSMKRQMETIDFDIALIGAGAYGFPLSAHAKRIGKKAVHIGGTLQIFFGIKAKFCDKMGIYNEYWTSPKDSERPSGFMKVESGRYW